MLNKMIKGFVVGVALIGSLTMVGCESTMSDDEFEEYYIKHMEWQQQKMILIYQNILNMQR